MMEPKYCRSCGAPIYWAKQHITGKLAPIDAGVDPKGNILLHPEAKTYKVLLAAEREEHPGWHHLNHFVTYPSAAEHSSKKKGAA